MKPYILLPEYNIRLLSFAKIYKDAEFNLLDDLHRYNLISDFKVNGDVRKLLMHHVILQLCGVLTQYVGSEKNIVYCNFDELSISDLIQVDGRYIAALERCIRSIEKNLPVRFYKGNIMFKDILLLQKNRSGESEEFFARLRSVYGDSTFNNFTFSKVRLFAQKNGLTFLDKEYFNTLKSKQLLMT